jgi:hypothetical protein
MSKKLFPLIIALLMFALVLAQITVLLAAPNYQEDEPVPPEDMFDTSANCAACHNNLVDEEGTDISFIRAWQSSAMAQAATDPYWQASVRKETLANPEELNGTIQDICATCHMPMAVTALHAHDNVATVLGDDSLSNEAHSLSYLAMDGVSCLVCHQIKDEGFGEEASFDGGFVIDTELAIGERLVYGTFEINATNTRQMTRRSGFTPVQGEHMGESELCATCHELITPFLDENGEIAGMFPEQTPYLEWQNSSYRDEKSCQDCHMPDAAGSVAIARGGQMIYENVGQHTFLGANAYLTNLLISSGANANTMMQYIQLTNDFLATQSAQLTLSDVSLADGVLSADVVVNSISGHKLPTSYPSRRIWLHFVVTDAEQNVVFESGAYEDNGFIIGNDNDVDGALYEPHYTEITAADEVQIYEPIMIDTLGVPTTTLLRASAYIKDNRIPPEGFDNAIVPHEIAVFGLANEDGNFGNGMDTVTYRIDVGDAQGPFTITSAMLYQSIGYRWAMDMQEFQTDDGSAPEIDNFLNLYDQTPNIPQVVAMTEQTTE